MAKLVTVYCSKDGCLNEANIVVKADNEVWPFCNWCISVTRTVAAIAGIGMPLNVEPLDDWLDEREHYKNPEQFERGGFLHSQEEEN